MRRSPKKVGLYRVKVGFRALGLGWILTPPYSSLYLESYQGLYTLYYKPYPTATERGQHQGLGFSWTLRNLPFRVS